MLLFAKIFVASFFSFLNSNFPFLSVKNHLISLFIIEKKLNFINKVLLGHIPSRMEMSFYFVFFPSQEDRPVLYIFIYFFPSCPRNENTFHAVNVYKKSFPLSCPFFICLIHSGCYLFFILLIY